MKRVFGTLIFILFQISSIGQSTTNGPELPQILPATPEAASITKGATIGTGIYTGMATASIPIYDLKLSGFSVPISLQYASSGFKVDEMPSRVGMGWSIGGSGVIMRIIHDRPDDKGGVRPPSFTSLYPTPTPENYYYYHKDLASNVNYDTEPDEFIVSAPGLSTRFIFNDQGEPIQFPYSNIKIQKEVVSDQFHSFTITNTDGTVYIFGGGLQYFDITQDHNLQGNIESHKVIRTAYYLKEIILTNGQKFTYQYDAAFFGSYSGVSQWSTRGDESNISAHCPCDMLTDCSGFPIVATVANRQTKVTYVYYNARRLTNISTTNGSVSFTYGDLPSVPSGTDADQRVTAITVNAGDYHRTYNLEYYDPTPGNTGYVLLPGEADPSLNPRYFLKEVNYVTVGPNGNEVLKFRLDYNDINSLPKRLSFAQDWVGYYNGKANNDFLALPAGQEQYWVNTATANKSPNWTYAIKGMLQKITYPTGGNEEFVYEANTHPKYEIVSTLRTLELSGSGTNDNLGTWQWAEFQSSTFTIQKAQSISVNISGGPNPACTGSSCSNAPSGTLYFTVLITNQTTGDVEVINLYNYASQTQNISINPGTFKVTLKVRGLPNSGSVDFSYDIAPGPDPVWDWVDHEVSGVRVKQIKAYDPVTNTSTSRYFKYASRNLLQKSTSSVLNYFQMTSHGLTKLACPFDPQICYPEQQPINAHINCKTNTIYSSSLGPVYLFGSNHIIYSNVIESDDQNFLNGGIEHVFNIESPYIATPVLGEEMKDFPLNTITSLIGYEIQTEYFDNTLQTVKRLENVFEESDDPNTIKGYTARRVREFVQNNNFGIDPANPLWCFDESTYEWISHWHRLKETITTEFAAPSQSLLVKNEYSYGNPQNILPIKTKQVNSKNEVVESETKYPTDFPSSSIYQTMVSKNILTAPIETTEKINSVPVLVTRTDYKDWFNNGLILKPERVWMKKENYLEKPVLHYHGYDEVGNLLQVQKEHDIKISYIWDYGKNFPTAEVKNASVNDIVHTSFESLEPTTWPYLSNANTVTASPAITGSKYYSGSFDINVSLTLGASYYVTYWTTRTTSYTIPATVPGEVKSLKTIIRNGQTWILYQHKIIGDENVSISGVGDIDELRIFPVGSQMSTYTYFPNVGIASICDANNKIVYYEYDAKARLYLVKDELLNILRQHCYNYTGQPENCGVKRYYNEQSSQVFTPICSTGYSAPPYTYIVAAGTYWSTISQPDANAKATQDIAQNGQAVANATCTQTPCTTATCEGKCIGGTCDLGTMITIAAERRKVLEDGIWVFRWYCTNVRCFSDGTYSAPSEDVSVDPCQVDVCQ